LRKSDRQRRFYSGESERFLQVLLQAGDGIPLPQDLSAKAFVIKAERDGLWEKSLIVHFPEKRRVLSTNDGFMDAMAVVNHSAHPELWKRVCQEMKTNARLTDGAMARAIVTATEAKTAAFEDLKVMSSYIKNVQATGTGTDSVIVVSGTTGPRVTYTGGHSRIGEVIGKAVYEAVIEALWKQNGFKKVVDR